jgi:hypothetical protein
MNYLRPLIGILLLAITGCASAEKGGCRITMTKYYPRRGTVKTSEFVEDTAPGICSEMIKEQIFEDNTGWSYMDYDVHFTAGESYKPPKEYR